MIRKIQIVLVVFVALSSFAQASVLDSGIISAIDDFLSKEWGAGQYQWIESKFTKEIKIPDGYTFHADGREKPRGNVIIQIVLKKDGRIARKYPVSVRVTPFAIVPVIQKNLARKAVIENSNVAWERREVTKVRGNWPESVKELSEKVYWSKRSITNGNVITWNDLEVRPDVLRGEYVKITTQNGLVTISVDGIAREDGRIGEIIRVENAQYRKVLRARVTDVAKVVVEKGFQRG
jgi:flagellar basal body P-ring formation protein FlgA